MVPAILKWGQFLHDILQKPELECNIIVKYLPLIEIIVRTNGIEQPSSRKWLCYCHSFQIYYTNCEGFFDHVTGEIFSSLEYTSSTHCCKHVCFLEIVSSKVCICMFKITIHNSWHPFCRLSLDELCHNIRSAYILSKWFILM